MSAAPPNTLYYGDNLDILRRYIDDESVDLIYLDPPFNSNADYPGAPGSSSPRRTARRPTRRFKRFEDTWEWGLEAEQEYTDILRSGHDRIAKAVAASHGLLGEIRNAGRRSCEQ
jgi:DNA modification methylase